MLTKIKLCLHNKVPVNFFYDDTITSHEKMLKNSF